MLVNATNMLLKARDGHYGVGQFNINNLEWTRSILLQAQAMQSPVILGVSEGAGKYMTGFKTVAAMVRAMDESLGITVPVALHLDHGTYEGAKACIEAGFTSIMFDGSHYPIEENIAKTRELVELAHDKGLSIEAEVGSIGGVEDGVVGNGEIADPEECAKITALGVDFLAPASATSTAFTPPTGRAWTLKLWSASIRLPTTFLWCCTAAPASPTRWFRKPSAWAFPRSTSTLTASWYLLRPPASTSKPARISRARAMTRASC